MWLYSFCDILNYIFTQIFIIDIQKIMIMQQTLFIVILAVVIWRTGGRKRKKTKWTI